MKKRRFTALSTAAVMLWCSAFPLISGCQNSAEQAEKNYYTVVEWLDGVEQCFNMDYYTEEEPLIQNVMRDSSDFDTIQIAAEWGLISAEDNLDFNSRVTKEFCADTLVAAMDFVDESIVVEMDDADKINTTYLDNVEVAVDQGIFSLENGKFDPQKQLTKADADAAMLIARDKWVNLSYGGVSYDKSVVSENVINLGGINSENSEEIIADFKVQYTGSTEFFDADGNYIDNTGKIITFSGENVPEMSVGSILAMPGDDVVPMDYAVKVTNIVENSDGTVTVYTEKAAFEEVYEYIDIQQSGEVDFSNAILFGPDGKRLTPVDGVQNTSSGIEEAKVSNGLYVFDEGKKLEKTGGGGASFEVDLGEGLSLSVKLGKDIEMSLKGEISDGAGASASVTFTESISTSVENKIEWGFLHLSVKKLRLLVSKESKRDVTLNVSAKAGIKGTDDKIADIDQDGDRDARDLFGEYKALKSIYEDLSGEHLKTTKLGKMLKDVTNVKLFDVIIPNTCIHFVVRVDIAVDGSISYSVTDKTKFGAEYSNKKLRRIDDSSKEEKLDVSAKVELTGRAGFEVSLLGQNVADVGIRGGVGFKTSSTLYKYNTATQTIEEECAIPRVVSVGNTTVAVIDNVSFSKGEVVNCEGVQGCMEAKIYPILEIYACSSSSLVGKFIGGFDVTILDEDDGKVLGHIESDNGIVPECTRGSSESYGIRVGSDITLNQEKYILSVGEENTNLKILTLPPGTTILDVKVSSDNPAVATAENLMKVEKAKDSGWKFNYRLNVGNISSKIYYKEASSESKDQIKLVGVSDGVANVTIACAGQSVTIPITVGNGGIELVTEGRFVVENTTINLKGGESDKIVISSAPEGYDLGSVVFSSNNTDVVTVDNNGKVTAKNVNGSAIVTVSTKDGLYSGACLVNVIAN